MIIETIEKYLNKPYVQGKDDCTLLVLDYLEQYEYRKLAEGRYQTIRGAKRVLPTLTPYKTMHDFLMTLCDVVEDGSLYDGDIVFHEIHAYLYWQGNLFGVHGEQFKLTKIDLPLSEEYKVYRKK